MLESDKNPKYQIEAWISVLSHLHSCLGLNREGEQHPQCKEILQILIHNIEELLKVL